MLETQTFFSLSALLTSLQELWPALRACEDPAFELLLSQWPELQIQRSSIFEAQVLLTNHVTTEREEVISGSSVRIPEKAAKKPLKEKRATGKKRTDSREEQMTQEDLWDA
jgi:hypothetical protein